MSREDVRKVSREDMELVRILIERYLQRYMNQKEVVDALSRESNIEPQFTELVWQQLEEQNREFFKAYYLRLRLKNQIIVFNKLLEDQLQIMNKEFSLGIPLMSTDPPNGSSSNPYTAPGSAMLHGLMPNGSSSGIMNGTPIGDQLIYSSKEMHHLHSAIDPPSNLQSTQNSAAVLFGVDNGTAIKTESGYSTNADFAFGNAFLESCQSIGDVSGGSFSSSELNGQPLNDSLLDIESSSFGFLNQFPQNFIFPDLVEDFSQSADSAGGDHTGDCWAILHFLLSFIQPMSTAHIAIAKV